MMPGIYFLLLRNKIVYIGKSKNVINRVISHLNNKSMKFNGFRIILCDIDKLAQYEDRWITKFRPKFNVKGIKGKYSKKMTQEWVRDNYNDIDAVIKTQNQSKYLTLVKKAKSNLGYSPTTDFAQIWQSINYSFEQLKPVRR